MTEYRLPPGMTADRLRELAEDMVWRGVDSLDAETVSAWADAIDPPEPASVVTDEMVEAVMAEVWGEDQAGMPFVTRAVLEAVERLGWLRDPDGDDLAERLAMAEGLLRRATLGVEDHSDVGYWWRRTSDAIVTPAEAEYLRSLDGEGDSDE